MLVDRLWPRGVSKDDAALDAWMQAIAPSDELREWFDHDPERWEAFVERYHDELDGREELVEELRSMAEDGTLTCSTPRRTPSTTTPRRCVGTCPGTPDHTSSYSSSVVVRTWWSAMFGYRP